LLAAGLRLSARQVAAGGAIRYEIDAREIGLAGAGWAARPDDAATLLRNPAGMSELDGGNPVGLFTGGSIYCARRHHSGLGYGAGLLSSCGMAQEYEADWVGRHYIQQSMLFDLTATPAVSYALNDRVSVGAGLNVMYGIFDTTVEIRNPRQDPDGELTLLIGHGNRRQRVGLLVATDDLTQVGVTNLAPVSPELASTPEFTGLAPGLETILTRRGIIGAPLDLDMKVPQAPMTSVHSRVSDSWSLCSTSDGRTEFLGMLAGRVAGEFTGTALHFVAASLEWEL
jgi:long-chain fatty acid transport protein